MYSAMNPYKKFALTLFILFLSSLSSQAYAGGIKIIIGGGHYDRHHYSSGYNDSHRLRNKYYFDNRYRKSYGDRHYGKRYYRNKYYGNNYRYNNRSYYRNNRTYCPY